MSHATGVNFPDVIRQNGLYKVGILLLVALCLHLIGRSIYSAFFGPLSKFPGPKLRAITQLPRCWMILTGRDALDTVALHKKYGNAVRLGPATLSFVGTPEHWRDIYGFKGNGQLENPKDPQFFENPKNGQANLIYTSQADHQRQRRVISHAFADKSLRQQEQLLKSWADKLRTFLRQKIEAGETIDMVRAYNYTTFDVMADLTFAEPLYMLDKSEYVPWVETIFKAIRISTRIRAIKSLGKSIGAFINILFMRIPSINKRRLEHWGYTAKRVDKRLAQTPVRPDLWTRILESGGDPHAPESSFPIGEHHAIAAIFMIGGTETTATSLSGTTYYLLRNPEWMEKLKTELRSRFKSLEDIQFDQLTKLPILTACLKEGLRMYPPVPIGFPRAASSNCMIQDRFVPEGTSICVSQLATYRSESLFKHADEFRPERWLGDPEFAGDVLTALEPFSVGPRNCVGKNLAWHELRLLLTTVLVHFDLELCPESKDWNNQKVYISLHDPDFDDEDG
ncbi:Sir2 histone deacetylase Hst2 [Exophiala oligosperma]